VNASQRNGPQLPDRSEPRTAACVFATVGSTVVDLKTAGFTAGRLKDAEFTPRYACNGSSIGLVDIPITGSYRYIRLVNSARTYVGATDCAVFESPATPPT
jgi:hypothetical protein